MATRPPSRELEELRARVAALEAADDGVDGFDVDALKDELAVLGWQLIAANVDSNHYSAARATGPLREKAASTPEKLLANVRAYELDLEARGGVQPVVVKQGGVSTADMTIPRPASRPAAPRSGSDDEETVAA